MSQNVDPRYLGQEVLEEIKSRLFKIHSSNEKENDDVIRLLEHIEYQKEVIRSNSQERTESYVLKHTNGKSFLHEFVEQNGKIVAFKPTEDVTQAYRFMTLKDAEHARSLNTMIAEWFQPHPVLVTYKITKTVQDIVEITANGAVDELE